MTIVGKIQFIKHLLDNFFLFVWSKNNEIA